MNDLLNHLFIYLLSVARRFGPLTRPCALFPAKKKSHRGAVGRIAASQFQGPCFDL